MLDQLSRQVQVCFALHRGMKCALVLRLAMADPDLFAEKLLRQRMLKNSASGDK